MFSDNEKISLRQLKRIVVFDLFSISWLIIPRIAVAASGRDGISAIILSILFALIYTGFLLYLSKCIGNNFMDYSVQTVGSFITFIIGVLYIIKLLACSVFVIRLFGEVIKETLLKDTDTRIIIFLLILIGSYAASKGFEVRARIAEVLYYIVIVPIILFTLMGIGKVDISNLMPIFTESPVDIVNGGYLVFLTFTMLELLLFSVPLIQPEKNCIKKEKKVFRYVAQSILIVGVLDLLFFIVTVGILGLEETKAKLWSTITIIQSIEMPGGFIQRQDAIVLAIWMLSIFTIISGFVYYLSFFTKHLVHGSTHKKYIIIVLLLLFGACAVPMDLENYFNYFQMYMKYIGMPQSIVLPIFVILIGKLRSKNKKTIVRSILLFATLISVTSFTGCKDMTEIEDRNFVQAMGIDLKGDEITVFYVLPDLKALTGQGSSKSDKLTVELKGKDFWEIEQKNQLQSDKRLDFSHIKAIILGNELAKDEKQLNEFLQYVKNKYELSRNTLIFLAEKEAKDIISISGDLSVGLGEYLDRLYRINLLNEGKEKVIVGDLISGKNEKNLTTMIPILLAEKKSLKNTGLGIFSNKNLSEAITEEESNYIYIANGYGKNSRLFIGKEPVMILEEKSADKAKNQKNTNYVIKINNISRKIDFTWNNGIPYMSMTITGYGYIEKGLDSGSLSKAAKADLVKKIESQCNQQILVEINKCLEYLMKTKNIDFLNLYRLTSYKNREMWLEYKKNATQFCKDLEYSIYVDLKLK